jgi:hypothetical protein
MNYHVVRPSYAHRQVEAWSGYQLQFDGMRRYAWQTDMAAELKDALGALAITPRETLTGAYISSDDSPCDTENRLFTNPGTSTFPRNVAAIRFERGVGPPPPSPEPITGGSGHVYYYRYRIDSEFEWWEPAETLARWDRVPRQLANDGSARPMWLAIKRAAVAGAIEVSDAVYDTRAPFGIRVVVHATARGPRSAPAISEALIDGVIAAFHAGAPNAVAVTAALAARMPTVSQSELEMLTATNAPGPIFPSSPFVVAGSFIQLSPHDERCLAGEVTIRRDSSGSLVETSGEIVTLKRVG